MSTVIGLVTEIKTSAHRIVYLGGDTLATDGEVSIPGQNKVVRLTADGDDIGIGAVGNISFINFLQYKFVPPSQEKFALHPEWYIIQTFVPALRDAYFVSLGDQGLACEDAHDSGIMSLLAFKGKLYTVDSSWGVVECSRGYDAIGSGKYIALGAANALWNVGSKPLSIVQHALHAACELHVYTGLPIVIEEFEWRDGRNA